jgi:DNA-binding response OmpR family regulator
MERTAVATILRDQGYDVQEAAGGDEVLHLLKTTEIALILLDLHMPRTNGFDVLSYVQQHRQSLPVIVFSGMPLDDIQHEIHKLPLKRLPPLLLKPIDLDQLMQLVQLQLSGQLPDLNDSESKEELDRTSPRSVSP